MIPPSGPCARPALARASPGRPAQRPTSIPSSSRTTTATYVWFMRARIWSAACCISSSGSRIGAMRWATDDSRPICSARCRLSASALRSASFPRWTSRARSAARAACSSASTSRRVDSSSWAMSSVSSRWSPSSARATSVSASASRSGQARISTAARQRLRTRISSAAPTRLAPRRISCSARPASSSSRPSTSPSSRRSSSRSRVPAHRSPASVAGMARTSATARTQSVEDHVALRAEPRRRLLEHRAESLHARFSPRCSHAMPRVSRSCRTSPNPACLHERGERFGLGEARDGSRQVRVGRAVAAHEAADARQHVPEVELVGGAERPSRRLELEDDEAAARPQGAVHLAKRRERVADVADPERHERAVEGAVANRQPLRVAAGDAPSVPLPPRPASACRGRASGARGRRRGRRAHGRCAAPRGAGRRCRCRGRGPAPPARRSRNATARFRQRTSVPPESRRFSRS